MGDDAGLREMASLTLEINKRRQTALRSKIDKLTAKFTELSKRIEDVDSAPDSELPLQDVVSYEQVVVVPGAFKPVGMLLPSQITAINSPFHEDSSKRERYIEHTTPPSITSKEQTCLQQQVVIENKRLWALSQTSQGNSGALEALSQMPDTRFLTNLDGLDWDRIAKAECNLSRSAMACKMKWINDLHPSVNHTEWTEDEKERLQEVVEAYDGKQVDWQEVSRLLGNGRTPVDYAKQCLPSASHFWTPEEDQRLLDAVLRYGENNWTLVSLAMDTNVNSVQCATRHGQLTAERVYSTGAWSPAEDELLQRAIARCGTTNFYAVSKFVRTRTRQQCRDRWENSLQPDPSLEKWTPEEDQKLLQAVNTLQEEYGSIKWKSVSMMIGEKRNDVACRAQYELLTKNRTTKSKPRKSRPKGKEVAREVPEEVEGQPGQLPEMQIESEISTLPTPAESAPKAKPRPKPRPKKKAALIAEPTAVEMDIDGTSQLGDPDGGAAKKKPRKSGNKKAAPLAVEPQPLGGNDAIENVESIPRPTIASPSREGSQQTLRRSGRLRK